MLQEHLFDVTDLQDREPIVVSKCGTLRVTFHYQVSSGNAWPLFRSLSQIVELS